MTAKRTTLARVAAVLGAACLLVAPLAPTAVAQDAPIAVYNAEGSGQGVIASFAVTPNIVLESAIQPGFQYADSAIESQGGGRATSIAALGFPGKFGVGAIGCSGLPGGQWVQAYFPPVEATDPETGQRVSCKSHEESTLNRTERSHLGADRDHPELDAPFNALVDRLSLTQGHIEATARRDGGLSISETQDLILRPEPGAAPVLAIETLRIVARSSATAELISHDVSVVATNVSLLGIVNIGTLRSGAETRSDGVTGVANGHLTFADITVLAGGDEHRATIDSDGIRITDPALTREQRLGIQEDLSEGLLNAGITITAAQPVEIVEGPYAEATVGGLVLSIGGRVPSVQVPDELAPALAAVIEQIPTRCLSEFGLPVPLCFGAGAIPGPGSTVRLGFNVATATSVSRGDSLSFLPGPGGGLGGGGGFAPPTSGPPVVQPPVGEQPGPVGTQGPQPQQQPPPVATGPLLGLVARLPAAALVWSGVVLLVLAVGAALGPSLRHAGSR